MAHAPAAHLSFIGSPAAACSDRSNALSLACFLLIGQLLALCALPWGITPYILPSSFSLILFSCPIISISFILCTSATRSLGARKNANQMRHDAQSCNSAKKAVSRNCFFSLVCLPTMAVSRLNHPRAGYWLKSFDPSV